MQRQKMSQYVHALENAGFVTWHTGGGCWAMWLPLGHYELLITNGDSGLPGDDGKILIGVNLNSELYDTGEEVEFTEGKITVPDMLALVERYQAKYAQRTPRVMTEPYTCPECGETRDHAEADEAACIHCGKCPACSPSTDLGLNPYCDECGGKAP